MDDHTDESDCYRCGRTLAVGEVVWADDWKVIDVSGPEAVFRIETRYTCDECGSDE